MLFSGTHPESNITENTLVYEDNEEAMLTGSERDRMCEFRGSPSACGRQYPQPSTLNP
jgi:hypothetical protein